MAFRIRKLENDGEIIMPKRGISSFQSVAFYVKLNQICYVNLSITRNFQARNELLGQYSLNPKNMFKIIIKKYFQLGKILNQFLKH